MLENIAALVTITVVIIGAVVYILRQEYKLSLLNQEMRQNHKALMDLFNSSQNSDEKELNRHRARINGLSRTMDKLIEIYNQDRSDRELRLFYKSKHDSYDEEF